mgnify:CR=1 FL=1
MKKDIFFRNGSVKFLAASECTLSDFLAWLSASFWGGGKGKMYRTAVLTELKRRVEVLS